MSFNTATIAHLEGVIDIDGLPYPPAIVVGPFAANEILTGTGNTAPNPVVQSVPIIAKALNLTVPTVLKGAIIDPTASNIGPPPPAGIPGLPAAAFAYENDDPANTNPKTLAILNQNGDIVIECSNADTGNHVINIGNNGGDIQLNCNTGGYVAITSNGISGFAGQVLTANGVGKSYWAFSVAQNFMQVTINQVPGNPNWRLWSGPIPWADSSGTGYNGTVVAGPGAIGPGAVILYNPNPPWPFTLVNPGTYRITAVVSINTNADGITPVLNNSRLRLCTSPGLVAVVADVLDRYTSNASTFAALLSNQMTLDLVVNLGAGDYCVVATNSGDGNNAVFNDGMLVGKSTMMIQQLA